MRRMLDSGVLVEVDRVPAGFVLRLSAPDRTAEWEISEAEADALMEGLMIEIVR